MFTIIKRFHLSFQHSTSQKSHHQLWQNNQHITKSGLQKHSNKIKITPVRIGAQNRNLRYTMCTVLQQHLAKNPVPNEGQNGVCLSPTRSRTPEGLLDGRSGTPHSSYYNSQPRDRTLSPTGKNIISNDAEFHTK